MNEKADKSQTYSGMENAPIKRDPALVAFSREHHFGLLFCWKLRQGLRNNISIERMSAYILFFFENDLLKHFEAEERELFPKLDSSDAIRQQAEKDHRSIHEIIATIKNGLASEEIISSLTEVLDKHIRFEERFLFNHLQQKLSGDELEELASLHDHKPYNLDNDWEDHFWKQNKTKV